MANHKSAQKRNRQNIKIRLRNRSARSTVRTVATNIKTAKDKKEALRLAQSALAKAATKGLVHKKNAARKIARLARSVAKAK